jgi:hypothetical protein
MNNRLEHWLEGNFGLKLVITICQDKKVIKSNEGIMCCKIVYKHIRLKFCLINEENRFPE